MVHGAPSIRVGDALFDGLPHIDLVGEIVPAGARGQLVDEALRVGADVRGVSHTIKLSGASGSRKHTEHETASRNYREEAYARMRQRPRSSSISVRNVPISSTTVSCPVGDRSTGSSQSARIERTW